jgi:transposase
MRFVAVKAEANLARVMLFRTRMVFVRQCTQMMTSLHGNLADEHGLVAARVRAHLKRLVNGIPADDTVLPAEAEQLRQI